MNPIIWGSKRIQDLIFRRNEVVCFGIFMEVQIPQASLVSLRELMKDYLQSDAAGLYDASDPEQVPDIP